MLEGKNFEEIEWCNFRWFHPESKKKRVLLLGDSITLGYSEMVRRNLENLADISYLATSRALDMEEYVEEIKYVVKDYQIDVVHINNGLHGWHLDIENYQRCLEHVIEEVKKMLPDTQIIWATTTQYYVEEFPERTEQVKERNRVSVELMNRLNIPVNPLYETTENRRDLLTDGIHYQEEGYKILAEQVAGMLEKYL